VKFKNLNHGAANVQIVVEPTNYFLQKNFSYLFDKLKISSKFVAVNNKNK
jgi:hypothetical protein